MDISGEISAIQSASRGSEIRAPIVSALNKLNTGTLPDASVSDAGKLMYVNDNGQWEAGNDEYIPTPTESLNITENGTYDVTRKALALVSVEPELYDTILWEGTLAIASTGGSSGTLATINDQRISADHVIIKFVAADPSKIVSDVVCNTTSGQAVITGISTAATTAEIVLIRKADLP